MAYTSINFKSKKAFKEAIAAGMKVTTWSPGPFPVKLNGTDFIEGPQYPEPHRWYAQVEVREGQVVKVK
jgi:hypothetical protein